jgi:DNA helicase-2/ATP-dependent DNA helicase PcrA
MAKTSKSTVLDVLKFATSHALIRLDDRIYQRMHGDIPVTLLDATEDEDAIEKSMRAYFNCSVAQLWGYQIYVDGESPFSTQHSIKGSEFERVMVVLDDEEGKKSTQYSYDKLFGIKPPSDTDKKNQKAGKDSVLDRTRRLLYVCCSRAVRDLAVVFFVSDVALAEEQIRAANIFNQDSIVNNLDVDGI